MKRFPILMYHRIASAECPVFDREEARYAIPLDRFIWQLKRIEAAGLRVLNVGQVVTALHANSLPGRSVVLTFDDGNRSDWVHALPLLRTRGMTATFFITVANIGKPDGLDAEMIQELDRAGMEIGSHGMTHRFLTTLDGEDLRTECELSKQTLSGIIGREIRSFAPPGGRINAAARRTLAACAYDTICTSSFGFNPVRDHPSVLRRFPMMKSTSQRIFSAILRGNRTALLPLYIKARALRFARLFLGEQVYHRSRSKALWD